MWLAVYAVASEETLHSQQQQVVVEMAIVEVMVEVVEVTVVVEAAVVVEAVAVRYSDILRSILEWDVFFVHHTMLMIIVPQDKWTSVLKQENEWCSKVWCVVSSYNIITLG